MNRSQRFLQVLKLESDIKDHFGQFVKEMMINKIIHTDRKYRADYWIPCINTVLEINGGQYVYGRHNRGGKGYENDLTKSNLVISNGLFYLQFTYEMIQRNEHLPVFKTMLNYYNPF